MKKDNFWHYSFDIPTEPKTIKERNISVNVEMGGVIPENAVLQYRNSVWGPTIIDFDMNSGSTTSFFCKSGTSGNTGFSGKAGTSGNSGFIPVSELTKIMNILNQNMNMLNE